MRPRIATLVLVAVPTLLFVTSTLHAQVATGSYPYSTSDNLGPDTINIANLNVHLSIPVLNKAGRGLPLAYALTFDNSIWYPNGAVWTPAANFGWSSAIGASTGYVSYEQDSVTKNGKSCSYTEISQTGFTYHDPSGVQHPFVGATHQFNGNCGGTDTPSFGDTARDGSGYTLSVTNYADSVAVGTKAGGQFYPPTQVDTGMPTGAATIIDRNGNEISVDASGNVTDTTGKVAISVGGTGTAQTFTYTDFSGNPQSVTVNYEVYTVETAFNCSGIDEYPPTPTYLIRSIVLPDKSSYTFSYEQIPDGHVTGRLSTVTLPQGGTISYTYPGANRGVNCSDGSTQELTRSINAASGSAASTWTYTRTQPNGTGTSHTEVDDGLSNYKEYDFLQPATSTQYEFLAGTYYETRRQIYQGAKSGTPVLSRSTCYNTNSSSCLTTRMSLPITQIDTYDTYNGLATDGATSKYDTYGDLTEADSYDFGSSARGGLLRKETWAYGYSIPGLPTNDIVYDGSGNITAERKYQYDNGGLQPSSGVPQHVQATCPCGNLISESVYASSNPPYTTTNTYEDTGSLINSKLTNGSYSGTTTLSYGPSFVYLTGVSLPTPLSGIGISYGAGYDTSNTGLPLSSTDPNNQVSQITSYDEMLRPLTATYPDGGETNWSYTPKSTKAVVNRTSSAKTTAEAEYDAYDRPSLSLLDNGQSTDPYYQQETCYDADGNTAFVSYRYQSTGSTSNCTTAGDSYSYDVLGRLTQIKHADNTTQKWIYTGRATRFTDENGVSRITQVDGLGRPTIVCELYSGNALVNSGSPSSCGTDITPDTGYRTAYAYSRDSTSGNTITTISQGAQTRTFWADWLSRPTKVIEPESGTTTYSYAYNATGLVVTRIRPKANQTGSATTTTKTQHDSLGRVTSISYTDGTPTKTFVYDQSSAWGATLQNPKGRLINIQTGAWPGTTGSIFSYDPTGRVIFEAECTPSTCGSDSFNVSAAYDFEGNQTQFTDAFGPTYTYQFTPANELISITSNWNDSNHPPNLLSNVQHGPSGPTSWNLGNGAFVSRLYDLLGRVDNEQVCTPSRCFPNPIYSFTANWTGNYVTSSSDAVSNEADSEYYDAFGRLSSITVNGTANARTYSYDRWGNRVSQSGNGGQPNLTFNTNNQIEGSCSNGPVAGQYCYDSAGNMTSDANFTYTYDAEGNVTQWDSGAAGTATYDAFNRRVETTGGGRTFELIFDPQGRKVSEWDPINHWEQASWFYWGGTRIGLYSNNTTEFEHQDWLGTERARTNVSGTVDGTFLSLPFGDGYSYTGSDDDPYHYATLEQDTPSDEHAQFREYSNMAGRWFSPDPYQGSYDPTNPQSFNRYAYVLNNPLSYIDPSGLGGPICYEITFEWSRGASLGEPHGAEGSWTENLCFASGPGAGSGSGPGPVGGAGAAPNNGPTFKQKNQNCLNTINATPDGKFYNFFSPLSMIPGIGPDWQGSIAEDVGGGTAKYVAFKFFQGAGTNWAGTGLGVIGKTVSGAIEGVAEGVLAPVAAAATVGQLTVHAGCAISAAF